MQNVQIREVSFIMKLKKIVTLLCAVSIIAVIFVGCGDNSSKGHLDGKWAYNHEPKKTALKIDGDTAVLDGEKYSCSYDDEYVILTDKSGNTVKHRYYMDGEDLLFYKMTSYRYALEGEPDDFIGYWENDSNWSFEFTEDGYFREDGYFPGMYVADNEKHSIMLMYNDSFQNTYIYYSLEGNVLTVEYPWKMVKRK